MLAACGAGVLTGVSRTIGIAARVRMVSITKAPCSTMRFAETASIATAANEMLSRAAMPGLQARNGTHAARAVAAITSLRRVMFNAESAT